MTWKKTEMIEENGIYRHPGYIANKRELGDGSETLLDMFKNVCQRSWSYDFLGTICPQTQKVIYESYGDVFKKAIKVSRFLRTIKEELKNNHADATNKKSKEKNFSQNKEEASNKCIDEQSNKENYEGVGYEYEEAGDTDNKNAVSLECVGIFSVNRAEWIISEYAVYLANASNCPLYSTFGAESIAHILQETVMKICFVSGLKAESLYKDVIEKNNQSSLKIIISYDPLDNEIIEKYKTHGITVYFLKDIYGEIDFSKQDLIIPYRDLPLADDIATVCYTSGTSGKPKGVLLSHCNFISTVSGFIDVKDEYNPFRVYSSDIYLSYLPLAHVMERVCVMMIIAKAAKVGFFRGNPKILQQDMKIIKPTFLVGVPRVFKVFKERIEEEINKKPLFIRMLVWAGIKYKQWRQTKGVYSNTFLDWLIFDKIKNEFGGKLRGGMNGSAPLSGSVTSFLQAVLSLRIFQGYGQTEGTAANLLMNMDERRNDNVGIPFPTNLIKLIPNNEYPGGDIGEICIKGENITKGYYRRHELNKNTFEEGWLKTGDIACVEDGAFKIVGRIKEIFKTSNGEYVIPERIENALKGGLIEDILITGKSYGDYVVAIIVCKDKSIDHDEIYKKVVEAGEKANKRGFISRFEIPKKIYVVRNDFDHYGELLTPTMKKKRSKIEEYFTNEIEGLYKK